VLGAGLERTDRAGAEVREVRIRLRSVAALKASLERSLHGAPLPPATIGVVELGREHLRVLGHRDHDHLQLVVEVIRWHPLGGILQGEDELALQVVQPEGLRVLTEHRLAGRAIVEVLRHLHERRLLETPAAEVDEDHGVEALLENEMVTKELKQLDAPGLLDAPEEDLVELQLLSKQGVDSDGEDDVSPDGELVHQEDQLIRVLHHKNRSVIIGEADRLLPPAGVPSVVVRALARGNDVQVGAVEGEELMRGRIVLDVEHLLVGEEDVFFASVEHLDPFGVLVVGVEV